MRAPGTPAERLADATIVLLLAEGFEGVSVRRVAAAAGVSIGAVQHHFPTKATLLQGAMDRVSQQARARIRAAASEASSPQEVLRTLAAELLAAGPEGRAAGVVWLQRAARAAVDPVIAAGHAQDWAEVEEALTGVLAACRPDQDAAWCADAAAALLAHLDGLAVAVTTEPGRMPPARAQRLVDQRLAELLGA